MSEKARARPSKLKGRKRPPVSKEWKENIAVAMRGREFSPEHRERLAAAAKRRWAKRKVEVCAVCGLKTKNLWSTHLWCRHRVTREEYVATYNHKVVSVRALGRQDVYCITVK